MSISHEQIRTALSEGCAEQEFTEIRCPKCGGDVLFVVHPKGSGFFIRCAKDNTHLSMSGDNPNPPAWWSRYVDRKGWIR
jgi:hypothetical protein